MSFTLEIKREIINREFSLEEAQDFIRGILATAGLENGSYTSIRISSPEMSNHVRELLTGIDIKFEEEPINKNFMKIKTPPRDKSVKHPNFFIGGLFVGGGSVSNENSTSYHLELQFHDKSNAKKVIGIFETREINFKLIQRRNKWITYLKKQIEISDFIKYTRAINSALTFEEARIERDMFNVMNRYSNLDIFNQSKLARASAAFKDLWEFVKVHGLTHEFKQQELNFFKLKSENQFSSLAELTTMYNSKYKMSKTKAGLNHWIYKLKRIVERNS